MITSALSFERLDGSKPVELLSTEPNKYYENKLTLSFYDNGKKTELYAAEKFFKQYSDKSEIEEHDLQDDYRGRKGAFLITELPNNKGQLEAVYVGWGRTVWRESNESLESFLKRVNRSYERSGYRF
jgi:hypothetical protein